jgi:hypothetical protein
MGGIPPFTMKNPDILFDVGEIAFFFASILNLTHESIFAFLINQERR